MRVEQRQVRASDRQGSTRGSAVFALRPGGKAPVTEHGRQDATRDAAQIEAWWRAQPKANLGAPIPPGYLVLDVDTREAVGMLAAQDLDFPSTVTAGTPRGWHYWFRCEGIECRPKEGSSPASTSRKVGQA